MSDLNLVESIKMAFSSLRANKLRSFLTMLGVIIGVSAVVAMVSVGQGAQASVEDRIGQLGSNMLIVTPGRAAGRPGGAATARGAGDLLSYADAEAIQEANLPDVDKLTVEATRAGVIRFGPNNTTTTIVGTTPEYPEVRSFHVKEGRFISAYDLQNMTRVAVLGQTVASDLFGGQDPLGQEIRIGIVTFTVIGVMEEKTQGMNDLGDQVFVPFTTAQKRLTGKDTIRAIYIQAKAAEVTDLAAREVEAVLLPRKDSPDKFMIRNQQEILSTLEGTTRTFTLLLAGITGISLLVGGIGIMNIMLVSVTERTREIGVRKAVGARRVHILTQFLIESVTLSTSGGLVGILAGITGSMLLSRVGQWRTLISPAAIAIAFGFAAGVGIFFGIYPANKAARLDPIESLRFE
ncbi:MAG: ABC transporter permease [Firmicutes bacterium]|nr:ABC transporter permease [Bacillota bacterium]